MSADKYPCIFSRQMKTIVYVYLCLTLCGKLLRSSKGQQRQATGDFLISDKRLEYVAKIDSNAKSIKKDSDT